MKIKKLLLTMLAFLCFLMVSVFAFPKNTSSAQAVTTGDVTITNAASINEVFLSVGANATAIEYVSEPDNDKAIEYSISGSVAKFYVWMNETTLCYSYIDVGLSVFPLTDAVALFKGLSKVETIDMSGFDIFNSVAGSDVSEMFYGCESLISVDLSELWIGGCTDIFDGCSALTEVVVGEDSIVVFSELKELWGKVTNKTTGIEIEEEPTITGETITFAKQIVQKEDAVLVSAPTANTLMYNGEAQNLVTAGTATNGTVVYKLENGEYSANIPKATNAGSYRVYYKVAGNDNYNDTAEAYVDVTISKANAVLTTEPTANVLTYNGNTQALVNAGTATNGTVVYKLEDGEYSANIPKATNAGSYRVYYKVAGNENYNDTAEAYVDVTIAKANAVLTTEPTANVLTYNGNTQALVNAGTATNGVVMYRAESGEYSVEYSENIPAGVAAATYRVYYKVVGNENYNDVPEAYVDVVIAKKEIVINWCANNFTYSGSVQVITATYKDVSNVDVALNVSVNAEFRNVGEYTATASFKFDETNYKLPNIVTNTYNIVKMQVSKPQADSTKFIYTGEELTYQVAKSDYYEISGNKKTNAGVYAVSVVLVDKTNTEWADSTTSDISFEFIIYQNTIAEIVDSDGEAVSEVKIDSVVGGVHPDAVLVVEKIKSTDSNISKLENILDEKNKENVELTIHSGFNISLMIDDVAVQPNGRIAFKIKVPEELKTQTFEVYHVHDSNSTNPKVAALNYSEIDNDGYIVIETDELSEFLFVLSEEIKPEIEVPYVWIIVGVLSFGVTVTAYFVITKKKKQSEQN